MSQDCVAAVILAAGASRRLGRPKQLLRYQGETLLGRAIRLAREAALHPVIVVLGADREKICETVETGDAIVVINDEWQEGIASSMRAGLGALSRISPPSAGVLFMPCDQPRLTAEHLRGLLAAFRADGGPAIAASVYSGMRGVPAVFPALVFQQLAKLSGDRGARGLLAHPPCDLMEVPFEGGELDIDFPGDLAQLG